MYTLTFHRSASKHFQKALNHLHNLGGTWDGQTARLEVPEDRLMDAYEEIGFLFGYIQQWKSLKATFRGKPVPPYRFIFQVWNTVNNCKEEKEQTVDQRYCWSSIDAKGWGCKHVQRIQRYVQGPAKYRTSNRYWYNFGEFIDKNTWRINKPLILEKIRKEVEDKALYLCPYFSVDAIEEAVKSLRDFVKVDNQQFCHYCTHEYIDGEKKSVPVNIRHIPQPKEMATIQDIINNDPGKYQWN